MLEKLWPFAAGILVFFGSIFGFGVLFGIFNNIFGLFGRGPELLYLVWLVGICLTGLTIGWETKGQALFLNLILSLIFFVPAVILGLGIPLTLLDESHMISRLLVITFLIVPFSLIGEKLRWRLHK